MMKKYLGLILGLLLLTGCSQFAMLSVVGSTASIVVSNNTFSKLYSGADVLTYMTSDKDIKTHVYEKATIVKVVVMNKIIPKKTFIVPKPITTDAEKKVLVAIPVIEVKESKLFQADVSLLNAKKHINKKTDWEILTDSWKNVLANNYYRLIN